MRTRNRIINRRPDCRKVKDLTHHYRLSAEECQIDACNLFETFAKSPMKEPEAVRNTIITYMIILINNLKSYILF